MAEECSCDVGNSDEDQASRRNIKTEKGSDDGIPVDKWQARAKAPLTQQVSYGSLGDHIEGLLRTMSSPMGDFVRRFCSTQPLPAAEPYAERKGDVLPIHPEGLSLTLPGVTAENFKWLKSTLYVLNYFYCCGWAKPICVPIDPRLTTNQKEAIRHLGDTITRNIISADLLPSPPKVRELLNSKRFDYCGNPVEHMLDLDAEKVIAAWPPVGGAGVRLITEFLEEPILKDVMDPSSWWLPEDAQPAVHTRSRVRATDETWFKLCKAAADRNMMKVVSDKDLHKGREGHYITNGAGAVAKKKEVNGKQVEVQRFISILVPTNEHSYQLPGEQDSLPYVGQLTGIVLDEEECLYLDSEDFTSAFNLFSVPDTWLPHFAFSKKVCASAFGGKKGDLVRPALSVIPMGWKSAVSLIQAAVRHIVFTKCKVPRMTSIEKYKPLPDTETMTIVYLDNFDELRRIRKFGQEVELGRVSEAHDRFNQVCDELGLSRNQAKQLIMSLTGGIQGGELDGQTGVLKVAKEKLKDFLAISLGMLHCETWREFHLRHWVGKAAFISAFRRPLFSVLEEVFPVIGATTVRDVKAGWKAIEEVLAMMTLAPHAEASLRSSVSKEISCTDASPTGGGCATATAFKQKSLQVAPPSEPSRFCVMCHRDLYEDPDRAVYPCPRACGGNGCSVRCAQSQSEMGDCPRKQFSVPKFGERFAGPNYPLTKAVALKGGAVQRPLDLKIKDNPWDFFTEEGKRALEHLEDDPALRWRHYGPNCRTFSRARGRPIEVKGKGKIQGPARVRSEEQPWGLDRVSRADQVKVRQDNKMAKRSIKGLETADEQGGMAGLEHPYESFLWYTEEAERIRQRPGLHVATWLQCCFGGRRTKWTSLLTNSKRVFLALNRPDCHCTHQEPYGARMSEGGIVFDTAEEAEYPWPMCLAYATAVVADLRDLMVTPIGTAVVDLKHLLYNQIMGATRGLQSEDLVYKLVLEVEKWVLQMDAGQEHKHLCDLARHVGLKGTDIRLTLPKGTETSREIQVPYPAFRWFWKTVMAYRWTSQQHINVLEMTAILAELRRRSRSAKEFHTRYVNIVDSMVAYWATTKGRSSSVRLNRTLRRMMSVELASNIRPLLVWTLSTWNFSDQASRKFEASSGSHGA